MRGLCAVSWSSCTDLTVTSIRHAIWTSFGNHNHITKALIVRKDSASPTESADGAKSDGTRQGTLPSNDDVLPDQLARSSKQPIQLCLLVGAWSFLAAIDLTAGLIGMSACGYAFGAFTNAEMIRRQRWWFIPTTLVLIALGGWLNRNEAPIWSLRVSLAVSFTAVLVHDAITGWRLSIASDQSIELESNQISESDLSTRLLVGDWDDEDSGAIIGSAIAESSRTNVNSARRRDEGCPDETPSNLTSVFISGDASFTESSRLDVMTGSTGASGLNDDSNFDSMLDSVFDSESASGLGPSRLVSRLRATGAFEEESLERIAATIRQVKETSLQLVACAKAGLLTKFQVEVIRAGRERSLQVGRYTVESVLGRGAMGIVYRAYDRPRNRTVALKLFRNPTEHVARIRREMAVLEELAHPNIVIALEVGDSDGRQFIALEWIDGDTLQQFVNRSGPLPLQAAMKVMIKITAALEQAHDRGILHRDIKPGNIMITRSGESKLLDLGISLPPERLREFDTLDVDGPLVCGTIGFMPPEQAGGVSDLDPRSDIFAIGSTLYFLLTGELFVEGETVKKRLKNTRTGRALANARRQPNSNTTWKGAGTDAGV